MSTSTCSIGKIVGKRVDRGVGVLGWHAVSTCGQASNEVRVARKTAQPCVASWLVTGGAQARSLPALGTSPRPAAAHAAAPLPAHPATPPARPAAAPARCGRPSARPAPAACRAVDCRSDPRGTGAEQRGPRACSRRRGSARSIGRRGRRQSGSPRRRAAAASSRSPCTESRNSDAQTVQSPDRERGSGGWERTRRQRCPARGRGPWPAGLLRTRASGRPHRPACFRASCPFSCGNQARKSAQHLLCNLLRSRQERCCAYEGPGLLRRVCEVEHGGQREARQRLPHPAHAVQRRSRPRPRAVRLHR